MCVCVCVCGFTTRTHVNALSSKHKFVSNHTIVSILHESIRGEQTLLWAFLSECVCVCFVFVFFGIIPFHALSYFPSISASVSSILISVSVFLSLRFSVCTQTYSPSLCSPILRCVCGVFI